MAKARDAFRTISEVAETLNTPAHVLRFWESKFKQIKPVKRAGGRRYYRPDDLALLAAIKDLLHNQGHSIKDTQRFIRESGVKAIVADGHKVLDALEGVDAGETIEAPKIPPPVVTTVEDQPDLFAGIDDAVAKPAVLEDFDTPEVVDEVIEATETAPAEAPAPETKAMPTLPPQPTARTDVGSRILADLLQAKPAILRKNADQIAPLAKKLTTLRDELRHPW